MRDRNFKCCGRLLVREYNRKDFIKELDLEMSKICIWNDRMWKFSSPIWPLGIGGHGAF